MSSSSPALREEQPQNSNLCGGLNPAQHKAVLLPMDAHAEVIAGAGTGKTRVLITRIAHLIAQAVPPASILAVTFTNKAKGEMTERLLKLVGEKASAVRIGTYHGIGLRILKKHHQILGLPQFFQILDQDESKLLVRRAMDDIGLSKEYALKAQIKSVGKGDEKEAERLKALLKEAREEDKELADKAYHDISTWKEQNLYPPHKVSVEGDHKNIYTAYEGFKQRHHALDFADLVVRCNDLFQRFPDIARQESGMIRHLLIDEFQDINETQYLFIGYLSGRGRGARLFTVGDQDQSIYGWRGSDPSFMTRFAEKLSPELVLLEENYRCSPVILEAANKVIRENKNRIDKNLFTSREIGDKIRLVTLQSGLQEANWIAGQIQQLCSGAAHGNNAAHGEISKHGGDCKSENVVLSEIAILYRSNAMSNEIEKALTRFGIPYRIFGATKFYDRKEIKDALSWAKVVANAQDNISMERVFSAPKCGVGPGTIEKLRRQAEQDGISLMEACRQTGTPKVQAVLDKLETLHTIYANSGLSTLFKAILEVSVDGQDSLERSYLKDGKDGQDRVDNLYEMLNTAAAFASRWEIGGHIDRSTESNATDPDDPLSSFLAEVVLLSGDTSHQTQDEDTPTVSLMTLHKSKGLEFGYVFMLALEEGIFPSSRAEDMEEERRLFYVGVTRAKHVLTMTYTESRFLHGQQRAAAISRFVGEVPPHLVDLIRPVDRVWSEMGSDDQPVNGRGGFEGDGDIAGDEFHYTEDPEDEDAW
ncbi:UvrD-helicase domain-containing protein [Acidithiobacillus ferrivorans]|nr:UvrD-helicase domain-containing protein [Acidithiobacillus ferrivorans]